MSIEEQIKKLLEQKLTLNKGEKVPIIVGMDIDSPIPTYSCIKCNMPPCNATSMIAHVGSKAHSKFRLKGGYLSATTYYARLRNLITTSGKTTWPLTPPTGDCPPVTPLVRGQPVPPGLELEVVADAKSSLLKENLMTFKSPLIGLEYVAEIVESLSNPYDPKYLCFLCGKRGDTSVVKRHLVTFNHRWAYVKLYFPRTDEALHLAPHFKSVKGMYQILSNIARAIEKNFGRLDPIVVSQMDIDQHSDEIKQRIQDGPHFYENDSVEYVNLVDYKLIVEISNDPDRKSAFDEEEMEVAPPRAFHTKKEAREANGDGASASKAPAPPCKRQRSLSPISSSSSRDRDSLSLSPVSPESQERPRSPIRCPQQYRRNNSMHPNYRHRNSPYRRPPPRARSRYSPSNFQQRKTPTVSQIELAEENERKEKLTQLQNFTDKLKAEIAANSKIYEKNPEKHPLYSKEWQTFWNKRYKELTNEGKDASKHDYKPEWIKVWTERIKELNDEEMKSKIRAYRADIDLPEEFSDLSDEDLPSFKENIDDSKLNTEAFSDLSDDELESTIEKEPLPKEETEVTVLSVLRLMAALEDQLGGLGHKVNSLLGQAVALETTHPGSSDELLSVKRHVVLLDTVKEKLKGQLFAGSVERHMSMGTKKTIAAVAKLFHAREEKKRKEAEAAAKAAEPVVVPGVGAVDSIAVAQQIAATLVAQGRTDLTDEDLEQLIGAVVGMDQPEPSKQNAPA